MSLKVTDQSLTPSKITDFYPSDGIHMSSPATGQSKTDSIQSTELDDSLTSSSVLLTPDASPVKEKDSSSENASNSDEEFGMLTRLSTVPHCHSNEFADKNGEPEDRETAHCKQIVEVGSEGLASVSQSSNPKKLKGRRGKAKSAQTSTGEKAESHTIPKATRKKKPEPEPRNTQITDFFPVRRSGRRCQSALQKEKEKDLEQKVLSQKEDDLKVVEFEGKGRGVVAAKDFKKGDFVVEYAGNLIEMDEAKQKESYYAQNPKYGCYMYYFVFQSKHYCVDATKETGRLGRLLNHSRSGNCQTKIVEIRNRPYLILVAARDIKDGEELLYDYGDRSKMSLEAHPWLKS